MHTPSKLERPAVRLSNAPAILLVALLMVMIACGPYSATKEVRVVGDAMAPTLKDGQLVTVYTGVYSSVAKVRGDIVLFVTNGERIARIIGLPGETIAISGGAVSIDGVVLSEPYLAPGTQTSAPQTTYVLAQGGGLFLLDDNRSRRADSRTLGLVPGWAIEGRIG